MNDVSAKLRRIEWIAFYKDGKEVHGAPGDPATPISGLRLDELRAFGLRGGLDLDGHEAVLDLIHGIFTANGVSFRLYGDDGTDRLLHFSFTRANRFGANGSETQTVTTFNLGYLQNGKLFRIELF